MINFCLALSRQLLLAPSSVSNSISCAGATVYKFGTNWMTEKIYVKNNPTSDTCSDQCAGSPTDSFIRASDRGTSCRAGIRSEVCGQWDFLKLPLPQRRDAVEGYHSSARLHPVACG